MDFKIIFLLIADTLKDVGGSSRLFIIMKKKQQVNLL